LLEKHLNILCLPLFAYDLVERSEITCMDFGRSLRRHRMIVDVLRSRDGDRAERVVRRLIRRFHRQDLADIERIHQQTAGVPAADP
jgi:DNA-binding GntR family transcriptional regulator